VPLLFPILGDMSSALLTNAPLVRKPFIRSSTPLVQNTITPDLVYRGKTLYDYLVESRATIKAPRSVHPKDSTVVEDFRCFRAWALPYNKPTYLTREYVFDFRLGTWAGDLTPAELEELNRPVHTSQETTAGQRVLLAALVEFDRGVVF